MQLDLQSDYHTHTSFSDGIAAVEEMVETAINKNLTKIVITDHAPLPFHTRYALAMENVEQYRSHITSTQDAYQDRIMLAMGMEFEFIPELDSWLDELLRRDWDHRIVSIHHLRADNSLHLVNGNAKEFSPLIDAFNRDGKALCSHYYRTLQKGIATGRFDIVGHLDVIKKHNRKFNFFNEDDTWYRNLVAETLDLIKAMKVKLEINTGGFIQPPAEQYPSTWIINAAREKNIPLVLSSDAHAPSSLGQYFNKFG